MKKQVLLSKIAANCGASLLALVLLMSNAPAANAASVPGDTCNTIAEVKYTGTNEEFLMFVVNYNNKDSKKFVFEISNDQNELLYRKSFNNKEFNKKVYFFKEADFGRVTFTIREGKKSYGETYEINPVTTYINELRVTKL